MKKYIVIISVLAAISFWGFKEFARKDNAEVKKLRILLNGKEIDFAQGIEAINTPSFRLVFPQEPILEELHVLLGYVTRKKEEESVQQGKRVIFSQVYKGSALKSSFQFSVEDFLSRILLEENKSYFLAFEARYVGDDKKVLLGILPFK